MVTFSSSSSPSPFAIFCFGRRFSQDDGLDTVDANRRLGFKDDERSYECVDFILRDMGIEVCTFDDIVVKAAYACAFVLPLKKSNFACAAVHRIWPPELLIQYLSSFLVACFVNHRHRLSCIGSLLTGLCPALIRRARSVTTRHGMVYFNRRFRCVVFFFWQALLLISHVRASATVLTCDVRTVLQVAAVGRVPSMRGCLACSGFVHVDALAFLAEGNCPKPSVGDVSVSILQRSRYQSVHIFRSSMLTPRTRDVIVGINNVEFYCALSLSLTSAPEAGFRSAEHAARGDCFT